MEQCITTFFEFKLKQTNQLTHNRANVRGDHPSAQSISAGTIEYSLPCMQIAFKSQSLA